jgi:SnoaL-like protein
MTRIEVAEKFFEACETGEGWQGCEKYCADNAIFAAEAVSLEKIKTLEGYADWMRALYDRVSDVSYEVKGFALDESRDTVLAFGVFHGTPIGDGPQESFSTNYVYSMEFEGAKIRRLTKIWNDTY